jgi:hypothetical protein
MRALVLRLSLIALSLSFSGCSNFDDLPPCDQKAIACRNKCHKSGAGSACLDCCTDAQVACTKGESYSFFWCPNKE